MKVEEIIINYTYEEESMVNLDIVCKVGKQMVHLPAYVQNAHVGKFLVQAMKDRGMRGKIVFIGRGIKEMFKKIVYRHISEEDQAILDTIPEPN